MEKTYDDDEIEIDLLELLGEFRRKIWIILGTIILFGGAAGAFSAFVLTPQYKSTAMVYILSKETTLTSLADLQIGSQLTKDYKIIVTSRRVLNQFGRHHFHDVPDIIGRNSGNLVCNQLCHVRGRVFH